MKFEWDAAKAAANETKHGVAFEAASQVFIDPFAYVEPDTRLPYGEDRFKIVGEVEGEIVLAAVWCWRGIETVRIISARKASRTERNRYRQLRLRSEGPAPDPG